MSLKHKDLTDKILNAFYQVYNELGRGFLESVYESALEICLLEMNLSVERQKDVSVYFHGQNIGYFKPDIIVNGCVILELKAVKEICSAHHAQILNYLKATDIEVGLILNFGNKPDFKRFAFNNSSKNPRSSA